MATNGDNPEAYNYQNDASYEQYDASYYGASGTSTVEPASAEYADGTAAVTDDKQQKQQQQQEQQWKPDSKAQAMIEELKKELETLDAAKNKHAVRLMNAEIERLSTFGEPEFLEVDVPKQIKIVRKVMVPLHRDPKFNFVGKLLGPGGRTLQNLISSTRCRIYILGRGSSREKAKEEELLASGDPKYAHFKDPLFVRVESIGTAAVAYQKVAQVLNELQYYLQPVRDDIYLQQMADMGKPMAFPPVRGGMRGSLMGGPPRGMPIRGSPRGAGPPVRGRVYLMQTPPGQQTTGQEYDYSGYEEYQQASQPVVQQYDSSGQVHMTPPTRMPPPPHLASLVGPPRHPPPPPVTVVQSSAYPPPGATYVYDYTQAPAPAPRALVPGPPPRTTAPPPPLATVRGRGILRGRVAIGTRPAPY